MKCFFSIFLSISMLLFFSCAGKPVSKTEEIDLTPLESVEPSDESENIEDEIITDEIAELESEDVQIEIEQIDDNEELTEVISDSLEMADLDEPAEDVPAPVEEAPPVEIAVQIPPPPPPAPVPPPLPEPEQPQTQTPPVRQPPLPPPALLGPAEEGPPSQREAVPPGSEPRAEPRSEPRSEPLVEQPRVEPRNEPRVEQPRVEPRSEPRSEPLVEQPRVEQPRVEPRSEPRIETPAPVTGSEPSLRPVAPPQNDGIVFSRTVRATVGQIIEIPFVGNGWIYMGELASRRGIVYSSTRRDPEGQSIIFGAEAAGTYVLRFFKENFLAGYRINDFVQVIVGEAPTTGGTGWFAPPYDRGRVVALPRWPSALDVQQRDNEQRGSFSADDLRLPQIPAESDGSRTAIDTPPAGTAVREPPSQGASPPQETTASQGAAPSQGTSPSQGATPSQVTAPSQGTVAVTEPAAGAAQQERLAPDVILQRAGETFTGGNVAAAIALLDQFREYYPYGSDELYWLYGQFYEANSPSRNILLSLDYYRRLVNEYPQSSRYNDARRRIAYLERFYINIQ